MPKLTKSELTKREELIMQMKKNKRNLVKKYGSDAEKVMYGRATNIAKKLAEQNMENTRLKEMVRAALSAPISEKVNEGPEDKTWGTYVKSLVNDIRLNGVESYTTFSEEDFIEDYKNFGGDKTNLDEDHDLGHEDNEPHMLKADLYRIGKYAIELYKMVDEFEYKGEVDFPSWWQAKISTAKENMVGAKHFLDFELKEPQIDAMLDVVAESSTMYYHVIEDVDGEKGWQGVYDTEKEAKDRADKLTDMFPRSFFYIEASNSQDEPLDITLEETHEIPNSPDEENTDKVSELAAKIAKSLKAK